MRIVAYVGNDPRRFAELMNFFLKGEYRVTQRAAWPISYCVQYYPELVRPWYAQLFRKLTEPGTHDAVARNILRLLQFVEIPKRYQGKAMTICFDHITNVESAPAIKACALSILQQLARHYPEIGPELKLIIEEQWDQESPAFRSRARKLLKTLKI